MDTVRVVGNAEFFRPTEATSATKIPLPIIETPQAITVLTEDIISLTGIRDLEGASGLVPGFAPLPLQVSHTVLLGTRTSTVLPANASSRLISRS